ncbi:fructose-1,6-bisphosphatase [Fusobacterium hominis]|uniref:Fructose-1,6-bisphosphatase class 3 n=1 Tax=Fusobacterium hominis TaxID=2764326 RepID=A0A7G9GXU5_9FUSO|nr:fructose-1,6-bisphosphatase [Fusobacterium hominis]QNM15627.1 fructose-1,6-bisphosphatase [Fusobacterium hominis]
MDLRKDSPELKYLSLLSKKFKNIPDTATEIINLQAILNLPKGTEHFLTDIHGEYDAFNHVLKNGSGSIRAKINDIFQDSISNFEKKELASVIYYPKEKVEYVSKSMVNMDKWYKTIIYRMIEVCSVTASKYTSSKVRKAMSSDFAYVLQEVLYERRELPNRKEYVESIIDTIISLGRAKYFVIAISNLIQRLTIDKLHIVGDIYDRGPYPHRIIDKLINHHNVDIQWGNHDMLWMGAALGNRACIANVIRICARYSNTDILEEGYGINLLPLARFVIDTYKNDDCKSFRPKDGSSDELMAKIHKGISIIQFKIEGEISNRHPDFNLENRQMLHRIDYEKGIVKIEGKDYKLNDTYFPTIDKENPYKLSPREEEVMEILTRYFLNSEKLQRHLQFFLTNGSLYLKYNSNLLYHGCIPLNKKGELQEVVLRGVKVKGKDYLDGVEEIVRQAYYFQHQNVKNSFEVDFLWYLWCGQNSPLFGKDAMKTFERYFIDDKETHVEEKNPYYTYCETEESCRMILEEFGLNPNISHIVNGHMPVKTLKGEKPVKGNGKLFVIDGGFSKAYQKETGIAGYTLVYNSYGLKIISHDPFESVEKAVREGKDIISFTRIVEDTSVNRIRVKDTDIGKELQNQINDLKKLLICYKRGVIMESYN